MVYYNLKLTLEFFEDTRFFLGILLTHQEKKSIVRIPENIQDTPDEEVGLDQKIAVVPNRLL